MKTLSNKQEDAAQLIVAGELSLVAIADAVGVTDRGLRKWRTEPAFIARVDEIRDEYRAIVRARGVAVREHRIEAYDRRSRLLDRVLASRAADKNLKKLPGGDTGLVVITRWESIKGAPDEEPTLIPVHAVDTAMLKEWRELEKQAAQDMGQWTSKQEVTGAGGGALSVSLEAAIAKVYGSDNPTGSELNTGEDVTS
jgi:hypothetical protein